MSRLLPLLRDALVQGPAGDLAGGRVYRRGLVARRWGRLLARNRLSPGELLAELQQLAQLTPEQAAEAARDLAARPWSGTAQRRDAVGRTLAHQPALVRRVLRLIGQPALRPTDLTYLAAFVPARVPSLWPGSRPAGVPLEVAEFQGGGGFAEVYLAHDPADASIPPLSLKVSFRCEGRRLLQHEAWMNGVAVGRGILPVRRAFLESAVPALAYPAVAGHNLRELLIARHRRGRPPGPRWVAALLGRLAQALDRLHERKYAHRDIKPSNIMIGHWEGGRREVVLLDLGISGPIAGLSEDDWPHCAAGRRLLDRLLIYGHSRVYASPEQLQYRYDGGHTRACDDVYSAGVVTIQALTGDFGRRVDDLPWQAELARRHTPWSFIALLEECVARDGKRRPRDGGELAERLRRLLHEADWRTGEALSR
jgi:serine/threonine-protein kinase